MNVPAQRARHSSGHFEDRVETRLLTLREAAEFLNVHPNTVRSQVRRGGLPGAQVGRGWRFLESDLVAWIRGCYRNVPKTRDTDGPWEPGATEQFMLPGERQSAERDLDALLERPASRPLERHQGGMRSRASP